MRWRGRDVFFAVNTALMVVPPVVMLMPLFILFTSLNLVEHVPGRSPHLRGAHAPVLDVYLLTNFFRAIPNELFESAVTDGARHVRILWPIVLPLSAPALVTLSS